MTTAMLFPDVFQRGTLTQPTFVCKLLLTALLILYAMRVCHCLSNEYDDDGPKPENTESFGLDRNLFFFQCNC